MNNIYDDCRVCTILQAKIDRNAARGDVTVTRMAIEELEEHLQTQHKQPQPQAAGWTAGQWPDGEVWRVKP